MIQNLHRIDNEKEWTDLNSLRRCARYTERKSVRASNVVTADNLWEVKMLMYIVTKNKNKTSIK